MIATILTGALLLAQTGSVLTAGVDDANAPMDVAYEELSRGEAEQALRELEAMRDANPEDPAVLINLGAAYSEMGELDRAEQAYRDAVASNVRYRLELADGSWVDSRSAARLALRNLESARLALR